MTVEDRPPTLSIGLPVRNGSNYLAVTLDSILAQTFDDFELVITDNCSDDDTETICRSYAERDQRIRYVRNAENVGAAGNYNLAFELARGRYFAWCAHDDYHEPEFMEACVESLEAADDSVVMVYPLADLVDGAGRRIRGPLDRIADRSERPYRRVMTVLSNLTMCDPIFGVFRTDALRRTGLIGAFEGADYVLLVEAAELGEIREIDRTLFGLRQHEGRSMTAHDSRRERALWYTTGSTATPTQAMPPWLRMVYEMERATLSKSLGFFDKAACMAVIPVVHYARRSRVAVGRLRRRWR